MKKKINTIIDSDKRVYTTVDGKEISDKQRVLLQERLDNEELDRLLDSKQKKSKKNKTSTNDALWAIADDMRARKEEGEFETYMDAYRWAEINYKHINNIKITAEKLQKAYHKSKSEGRLD